MTGQAVQALQQAERATGQPQQSQATAGVLLGRGFAAALRGGGARRLAALPAIGPEKVRKKIVQYFLLRHGLYKTN